MATQITQADKHDPATDTRQVSLSIQVSEAAAARLDGLAIHLDYATTQEFLSAAITSLAEKLSADHSGEAPYWGQPDKLNTYEVDFTVIYHGQIQADTWTEAEDILARISVADTADDREWHVDPWEFQKSITAFYPNAEDDDENEEGNGDGNYC